jgi:hypothetical protein
VEQQCAEHGVELQCAEHIVELPGAACHNSLVEMLPAGPATHVAEDVEGQPGDRQLESCRASRPSHQEGTATGNRSENIIP